MKDTRPYLSCPNCSHENPEAAKFCQNCGQQLVRPCPSCGTQNEPGAKFCMNCGGSLLLTLPTISETRLSELQRSAPAGLQEKIRASSSEIEGERKPVTILFTDIVGSTSIAEKLDPEEWKEIVSGAHLRVGEAIYRYEGTIAQLLGDGVLAFFGAPITHEDDPIRAVRAALDIQESIMDYAHDIEDLVDSFQMRIGINTGEVVIGNIGTDMHMEYLAIGDAVNVAARLQSAADPGKAIVSGTTNRLLGDTFEFKSLGEITVKGKEESVEIFEIIGINVHSEQRRGIRDFQTPFVDRENEFETLRSCLLRLCEGHGQIVSVIGEAGIGKSRLVAEVRENLCEDDSEFENLPTPPSAIQWLEGRALSYGGSLSYWTITQLLLADLGLSNGASKVKIKVALRQRMQEMFSGKQSVEVMPFIANLLGIAIEGEPKDFVEVYDGENLKKETHRSLQAYFTQVANEKPSVLILEDMHWADPSSLEVIDSLLSLTDHIPLLILLMMRTEREHGSWEVRVKAETDLHHRFTDIHLQGLSEKETSSLVDHLLGTTNISEEIYTTIIALAEGNPFYIEEVVRHMIEEDMISKDEKGWYSTGVLLEVGIPDTLQGVLLARIDRLEEDVRYTLQMASVIGKSFLYRILEAISDAERELDAHLSQLQRQDLVREKTRIPELEYIFKQTLTQEAAYNSILHERRKDFHKKVGKVLEQLFPDRVDEFLGLLAYHFEMAEVFEKAVDYLQRAGDKARLAYAHQEAVDFYNRVLTILQDQENYDMAARTLMKLGLTYHSAFDYKRSRDAYDEAFRMRQQDMLKQPTSLPIAPHPFREHSLEPLSIDPTRILDGLCLFYIRNLFSGLVELGTEGEILPDVAKSWEISETGDKYIFYLRNDVFWSDGQPVTAEDFVCSIIRVLDPNIESHFPHELFVIKNAESFHQGEITDRYQVGVRAVNQTILEIVLENPASYFLHMLANIYPIPLHVVETQGEAWASWEKIVVNGPFIPESFHPNKSIILIRNPNYHGRFPGNLQNIQITLQDPHLPASERAELSYEMYRGDSLDYLGLNEETLHKRHLHTEEYISGPIPGLIFILFDPSQAPFDDERVRKAFALSLDKEILFSEKLERYHYPGHGGIVPPGVPGHSSNIGIPFDPETAQQLLDQAGYLGGKDFPSCKIAACYEPKILNEIVAQWNKNLNIQITIEVVEYKRLLMHDYDRRNLTYVGWRSFIRDPDYFLRVTIEELLPSWRNDVYDQLIQDACGTLDQVRRIQLYQDADKILIDEAIIIPVAYFQGNTLIKPWVKTSTRGIFDWIFKDVIIGPH